MTSKPALIKLETNVAPADSLRSSYPSELSALSEGTPISAHPLSAQVSAPFTAPIMPPPAYTDFLKSMLGSPTIATPRKSLSAIPPTQPLISRTRSASTTATTPTSPPSTASPASTSASLKSEQHKRAHNDDDDDDDDDDDEEEEEGEDDDDDDVSTSDSDDDNDDESVKPGDRTTPVAEGVSTPATPQPNSAPAHPTSFPSFRIPPSPSLFTLGGSPMASPYSATFSATSPNFPPYSIEMANIKAKWDISSRSSSKTVRYRSVITRTITYAPKINAVPKNKRRRVD